MSQVGDDLIEAFGEMAADLRGDVKAESYEVSADLMSLMSPVRAVDIEPL